MFSVLPGPFIRYIGICKLPRQQRFLARLPQMQSTPQQQMVGGNKSIHINLSDEFAAALKGSFQDSAWQGIDIRCSQQEERSNPHAQGSYMPVRPQSTAGSLHQRIQAEHSGDSVHQET
ncbi:hypothetical protein OS493_029953 [Desmophyllum pertusum]|uniref:Uncharacterized protein n=1 Tax=Desmophyllum pertusum TaxID=174260 RepID=A0A9W9ZYQ0_9CNID|nr:hypothetical protein OS493_029953 [Desmophyllum pertusum]